MFGHKDDDDNHDGMVMPPAEPLEEHVSDNPVGTGPVEPPTSMPDPMPEPSHDDMGGAPSISNNDDHTNPVAPSEPADEPQANTNNDDLLNLKKDALEELVPLVGHLDQSPEERFKTTMMMIQATDASGLIQDAYNAAKDIPDEKARAQALLDVVNEINYFTQANSK